MLFLIGSLLLISIVNASELDLTQRPVKLPVVNGTLQVTLLIIILTAALCSNASVIINITTDRLKLKMIHFILIRHVCITDFIGALFILPVPLIVVAKGEWKYDAALCSVVSTTTAACWTMHLIAVAMYRADRVLAVWLPTGKYPVISIRHIHVLLIIIWLVAISGSYGATIVFGPTFQPALALCIPDVPLIFFIVIFSGYCIGLISLTTGYLLAFVRRRRKKRKAKFGLNAPFEPEPVDFEDVDWKRPVERPRSQSTPLKATPILPTKTHRRGQSETYSKVSSDSTSTLGYERLYEEVKLTHSVSLDEKICPRPVLLSRSFDCTQLEGYRMGTGSASSNSNSSSNSFYDDHFIPTFTIPTYPVKPRRKELTTVTTEIGMGVVMSFHSNNAMSRNLQVNKNLTLRTSHHSNMSLNPTLQLHSNLALNPTFHSNPELKRSVNLLPPLRMIKIKRHRTSTGRRALASYAVSVGHLLLYLPAMFVIGLNRGSLPPGAALFCGLVIYCEFIIQPIALLLVSQRLRLEVFSMWSFW